VQDLLFVLAIGVIASHMIDDHYLQPQPRTATGTTSSAGHAARVLGLGPWGGSVQD
jgi:hypothetical protein